MTTDCTNTQAHDRESFEDYVGRIALASVRMPEPEPAAAPKRARRSSTEVAAEKALIARIERAIEASPVAVERAILLIAANQTSSELSAGVTVHENGIGFTGCDANLGTWLYKVIRENEGRGMAEGQRLRGKALDLGRKVARRYARTQLLTAAKAKAAMH
jgi:hypothetical protein